MKERKSEAESRLETKKDEVQTLLQRDKQGRKGMKMNEPLWISGRKGCWRR